MLSLYILLRATQPRAAESIRQEFTHVVNRITAILLALLALSACTHFTKDKLTYDGPSPWADQIRQAAVEAYPYAQMSYNAYAGQNRFDLGPDYSNLRNAPNDDLGFAYSLFHKHSEGQLTEVIIGFRGTEPTSVKDWVPGNIIAAQNARGLAVYEQLRKTTPARIPITVTGHSLGGGIATQVSLRHENVKSYIFNSSPRFWKRGNIPDNRRLSIVERGEGLKVTRLLGREAPQTYISINCIPGFAPIGQHGMRPLAECLTQIAAWDNRSAQNSLDRNRIPWPQGLARH